MGYAILLSREGRFLYHPNPRRALGDHGRRVRREDRRRGVTALAGRIVEGQARDLRLRGAVDRSGLLVRPRAGSSTGWTLVSVFVKDDIAMDETVLRRWEIAAGAGAVLFVISGTGAGPGSPGRGKTAAVGLLHRDLPGPSRRDRFHLAALLDVRVQVDSSPGRIANDAAGLEAFKDSTTRRRRSD